MGSSPASSLRPDDVRANQILEDGGTRRVKVTPVQDYGGGLYANIPALIAQMFDLEKGDEVELFVNLELGCVIVQIQEPEDGAEQ